MKKIIQLGLVWTLIQLTSLQVFGQWQGTNPVTLNASGANAYLKVGLSTDYSYLQSYGPRPLRINDLGNDVLFNHDGGNVGIGTLTPDAKLNVVGAIGALFSLSATGANAYFKIGLASDYAWIQSYGPRPLRINDLGNNTVFNTQGGNVGIGTSIPDTKLAVVGTIHSNEVKVDLSVPGPDYVFEDSYDLLTLQELSTYVKQNKHLPEIPPAKTMEKYGLNLGEMNLLLLKKVEELTLYIIHQDEQQKTEISKLKEELELLKSKHLTD